MANYSHGFTVSAAYPPPPQVSHLSHFVLTLSERPIDRTRFHCGCCGVRGPLPHWWASYVMSVSQPLCAHWWWIVHRATSWWNVLLCAYRWLLRGFFFFFWVLLDARPHNTSNHKSLVTIWVSQFLWMDTQKMYVQKDILYIVFSHSPFIFITNNRISL